MARVPEVSLTQFRRIVGVWMGLILLLPQASAAAPVLDHLFPAGLQAGTSNSVTFVGKFDPWPPRVWSDAPGLTFEPTTNNGVFTVWAATNTPPGPHFVRTFNGDGASAPRFLWVTQDAPAAEVEPNGEWNNPQALERLPATINGRLEKNGDVDSYAVRLEAGQTLVAWIEAYTLMSPLDPVLRLVDSRGIQVAWNHDDGRSLDPLLAWTAPAQGSYTVQVFAFAYPADSDIRFTGNARAVYRLHLTSGPVVRHTLPLGIRRGVRTPLQLRGWNLGAETNPVVEFDGGTVGPTADRVSFLPVAGVSLLDLQVGDGPEGMESEPNSKSAEANPIELPGARTGELGSAGDEDRYRFTATQGEGVLMEIQSAALGFPLDAWLRVEDLTGRELARNDDATGADPRLEWTASEDGTYVAAVGNVLQRGGESAWYRLSVRRPVPALKATVADNTMVLEPGKTHEITVTVTRQHGFDAPLQIRTASLPEGVRAEPVEVSAKGGATTLKLVAADSAAPFSGPIGIQVVETGSGREHAVTMELVSAGENNGVPQGFRRLVLESISQFWLTVLPAPAPAKAVETK